MGFIKIENRQIARTIVDFVVLCVYFHGTHGVFVFSNLISFCLSIFYFQRFIGDHDIHVPYCEFNLTILATA